MAITFAIMAALWRLKEMEILPGRSTILDLGEQNWYGDTHFSEINRFIEKFVPDKERRLTLEEELNRILEIDKEHREKLNSFEISRFFYKTVFDYTEYRAIDLHGTPVAEKHDLNYPVPISEQFDLLINFGTAEHVFNVAQVFQTIHERTKAGGFILHFLPNQGCYDHGFYNFHPTFLYDLAAANGYELPLFYYVNGRKKPSDLLHIRSREDYVRGAIGGELSDYSHLFAAFQKKSESEFRFPQQAFYDNNLPEDLRNAWKEMER